MASARLQAMCRLQTSLRPLRGVTLNNASGYRSNGLLSDGLTG